MILCQVRSDVVLFEERSVYLRGRLRRVCPQACLLLKTGESVAFFMGKRVLCNPVKHQLKKQTGKHFHPPMSNGGSTSGAPQLRSAKEVAFFQDGSLLKSFSLPLCA